MQSAAPDGEFISLLTFRPIQRIVPTSCFAKGDNNLSTDTFSPVFDSAFNTEFPEYKFTSTVCESYVARPTSSSKSTGSPIAGVVEPLGKNRIKREKSLIFLLPLDIRLNLFNDEYDRDGTLAKMDIYQLCMRRKERYMR